MTTYQHKISDGEAERIQRFLYWLAAGVVAFAALIVIAILTADMWLKLISPASERRFTQKFIELADEHLLDRADPVLQDYVAALGRDLAAQMDLPDDMQLEFIVLDGSTVNAFTTLGGYIFVFDGLMESLPSENSLSMVIAHEIAHAKQRDPLLATGRGVLLQLMISSLSGGGVDPSMTNLGSELMLNIYSREQEQAADRLALAAMQDYYGHVGGATELFSLLQEETTPMEPIEILSSHPDLGARIDYLRQMAEAMGWAALDERPYPEEIARALSSAP